VSKTTELETTVADHFNAVVRTCLNSDFCKKRLFTGSVKQSSPPRLIGKNGIFIDRELPPKKRRISLKHAS